MPRPSSADASWRIASTSRSSTPGHPGASTSWPRLSKRSFQPCQLSGVIPLAVNQDDGGHGASSVSGASDDGSCDVSRRSAPRRRRRARWTKGHKRSASAFSASFQPLALVAPNELQRAQQQGGADHDPGNADPRRDAVGLGQRDARQHAPGAGEGIAEVLADRDPEIAVERLKDDVDRLLSTREPASGRCRLSREIRDQERPADESRGTGRSPPARRRSSRSRAGSSRRRRSPPRAGRRAARRARR